MRFRPCLWFPAFMLAALLPNLAVGANTRARLSCNGPT